MLFIKRKTPIKIQVAKYKDIDVKFKVWQSAIFWANSSKDEDIIPYVNKIKENFVPVRIWQNGDNIIKFVAKEHQKHIEYKYCKSGNSLFNKPKTKLKVIGIKTKNATVYPNIL